MPIDGELNSKLMYSSDGENFTELKEVNGRDISITIEPSPLDDYKSVVRGGEMTFSCSINPVELMGIILGKLESIRYYQSIKSNNWLKMHGLPMRRKSR